MPRTESPLRYPGGKGCLTTLLTRVIRDNGLKLGSYAEPYAGGCGLALALLYGSHVSDIHINDIDPAIWCFWHAVLNDNESIVALVAQAELTIEEWRRQREIYLRQDIADPISLGFATFYLNRTNRSGIIKTGGIIGGLKQSGNYKMDCRFHRDDLIRRVKRVAKYRNRIHLYRMDALKFLRNADALVPRKALFFIDPPYFNKGATLYTSFYRPNDHTKLRNVVDKLKRPWIVTYDNTYEINKLYIGRRQFIFDVNYSAQTKRVGSELLIASEDIVVPPNIRQRQVA